MPARSHDRATERTIGGIALEIAIGLAQIVAAVVAVVALIVTSRSRRDDAIRSERALESAERAAERSEAASSLSIDQLGRIAVSIESLQLSAPTADAPTRRKGVAWTLSHQAGDTYLLENDGGVEAQDVEVTGHESLIGPDIREGDPARVAPREALSFLAARSMATSDSTITVTWLEEGSEDRREWRYPLPPRPKR